MEVDLVGVTIVSLVAQEEVVMEVTITREEVVTIISQQTGGTEQLKLITVNYYYYIGLSTVTLIELLILS